MKKNETLRKLLDFKKSQEQQNVGKEIVLRIPKPHQVRHGRARATPRTVWLSDAEFEKLDELKLYALMNKTKCDHSRVLRVGLGLVEKNQAFLDCLKRLKKPGRGNLM